MELYSAGTGNGMRADCIFGVLDYDERPLLAESGPCFQPIFDDLNVRFGEKRTFCYGFSSRMIFVHLVDFLDLQ